MFGLEGLEGRNRLGAMSGTGELGAVGWAQSRLVRLGHLVSQVRPGQVRPSSTGQDRPTPSGFQVLGLQGFKALGF